MSVINCFKGCESNCECKETESVNDNSLNSSDVVEKFEKYRLKAEQILVDYEEAKLVIDRLREELNICRDIEKSNSHQILSLQSQLKVLEEKGKTFFVVSEKQRSIHKTLQKHDESINEIQNVIKEVKENFRNKISTASKEIELIEENRYFKSALQSKEEILELVRNEMKNVLNEKEELIQQYISRNNQLNEELENLKSERDEIKDFCNKNAELFKKRIDEYEAKIKKMEQEQTRILADYEVCVIPQASYESTSEQDPKISKSLDAATKILSGEREDISAEGNAYQEMYVSFNSETQATALNFSKDEDFKIKQNTFVENLKKKPKIEFIDSCEPQIKRRLYCDNDNNYLN